MLLQATGSYEGALAFTNATDMKLPIATGSIHGTQVEVAAWKKTSKESNKDYLSLKVSQKGSDEKLFGRLFKNDEKKSEKSPDYTGYISFGDSDEDPVLRIAAWRNEKDGVTSIGMRIAPPQPKAAEGSGNGNYPF